jgi:hypothetical protein
MPRVVRNSSTAAAHVGVRDALAGALLADDLLADQRVDQQQLEVVADLALGDREEQRVRACLGDGELADRLAVDAAGPRRRRRWRRRSRVRGRA